ncbi:MAG: hypothetical protein JXA52_07065, partial [Planctomycetes bacterium]|nr:hypothetical protein [Planctomycetota bacterium]
NKKAITEAIEELRKVKNDESKTVEEIDAAMKNLESASHKLAEAMYQKVQESGGQGMNPEDLAGASQAAGAAPGGEGNVVDADFEVVDEEKEEKDKKKKKKG